MTFESYGESKQGRKDARDWAKKLILTELKKHPQGVSMRDLRITLEASSAKPQGWVESLPHEQTDIVKTVCLGLAHAGIAEETYVPGVKRKDSLVKGFKLR